MARLPSRDDLGGLPSARSGRVIANYDTSAVGKGLADAGAALESASTVVGKLAGTGGGSRGARVSQAEAFEAQRKFLEFQSAQEQAYEESKSTVDPGAFGFREQAQQNYLNAAKDFFTSIPDALKPEYDMKLFQTEDALLSRSRAFETTERTRYYGEEVNKGLGTLENKLFSNPGDFDKNFSEGVSFINAIPDESLSRIQKADLVKQWRTKAQLASLNGVTPQERARLLWGGGIAPESRPDPGRSQAITRGISGDVRKVVSDAAMAYGVDPNALLTIAWIESKGDPNAKNPNSSAGGLFQFINSTARAYGLQNKFDPAQAADAGARLMRDNSEALEKVLGRKPTTGELYLAHQQGIGGAVKLLSNPTARAADVVGSEAVRLNGGTSDMTAGDFASLWMKKAGDTHVPDGGIFNAKFDPARADPRFADLPYEVAQKVISGAQAEIEAEINAAEAADKLRAASAKVQYDQHKGSLELAIQAGDVKSELAIINDETLTDAHKADLLKEFRKRMGDELAAAEVVKQFSNGSLTVDPYDTKGKNTVDGLWGALTKGVEEGTDTTATAEEIVRQTGTVPQQVVNSIRKGATSTDPEELVNAARTAQRLSAVDPAALARRDGGSEAQKLADTFSHYVNNMGLPEEEAAQKVINLRDPEKVRQRDAILKSEPVKKVLKAVSASDVAAIFDEGFWSPAPDVGGIPSAEAVKVGVNAESEAAIVADYRSMFEEAIAETNGDMDAAKDLAGKRFQRNYGVSGLSPLGSSVVIKYPPEKAYPAIDGGYDYIRNQAVEALKEEGVEADAIYLHPYERTAEDIRTGKPAHYQIFYDQDGKLQSYFLPFRADPGIAQAEFKARQDTEMRAAEEQMLLNRAEEQYRFPEGRGRVERFQSGRLYRGIAREGSPMGEALRRAQDESERIGAKVGAERAEEERQRQEFLSLPEEEQRDRSLGDFLGGPVQLPRK